MVLVINDRKEEFEEKVRRIYEMAQMETNVSFAIGSSFEEEDIDIRKALRIADEKMYEDKEKFYVRHPELRYR